MEFKKAERKVESLHHQKSKASKLKNRGENNFVFGKYVHGAMHIPKEFNNRCLPFAMLIGLAFRIKCGRWNTVKKHIRNPSSPEYSKAIEHLENHYNTMTKKYPRIKSDDGLVLNFLKPFSQEFKCNIIIHNNSSGLDTIVHQELYVPNYVCNKDGTTNKVINLNYFMIHLLQIPTEQNSAHLLPIIQIKCYQRNYGRVCYFCNKLTSSFRNMHICLFEDKSQICKGCKQYKIPNDFKLCYNDTKQTKLLKTDCHDENIFAHYCDTEVQRFRLKYTIKITCEKCFHVTFTDNCRKLHKKICNNYVYCKKCENSIAKPQNQTHQSWLMKHNSECGSSSEKQFIWCKFCLEHHDMKKLCKLKPLMSKNEIYHPKIGILVMTRQDNSALLCYECEENRPCTEHDTSTDPEMTYLHLASEIKGQEKMKVQSFNNMNGIIEETVEANLDVIVQNEKPKKSLKNSRKLRSDWIQNFCMFNIMTNLLFYVLTRESFENCVIFTSEAVLSLLFVYHHEIIKEKFAKDGFNDKIRFLDFGKLKFVDIEQFFGQNLPISSYFPNINWKSWHKSNSEEIPKFNYFLQKTDTHEIAERKSQFYQKQKKNSWIFINEINKHQMAILTDWHMFILQMMLLSVDIQNELQRDDDEKIIFSPLTFVNFTSFLYNLLQMTLVSGGVKIVKEKVLTGKLSRPQYKFEMYLDHKFPNQIKSSFTHVDGAIRCGKYILDALHLQNKTVYEYNGCWVHPDCIHNCKTSKKGKKFSRRLNSKKYSEDRKSYLYDRYQYKTEEKTSCTFDAIMKLDKEFSEIFKPFPKGAIHKLLRQISRFFDSLSLSFDDVV